MPNADDEQILDSHAAEEAQRLAESLRKRPDQLERLRIELAKDGHLLVSTKWARTYDKYHVVCSFGHDCYPTANVIFSGSSPCVTCANDAQLLRGENMFLQRLQECEAAPKYDTYLGASKKHEVICPKGHLVRVTPGSVQSKGSVPCQECYVLRKAEKAEKSFLESLQRFGVTPTYPEWKGAHMKHAGICAEGHECYPIPSSLSSGKGPCTSCIGRWSNRVYIVANPEDETVKVGISSGMAKTRLEQHRKKGFTDVHYLSPLLEDGKARVVEVEVLNKLKEKEIAPVHGLEYFDISCAPLIKDLVKETLNA